MPDKTMDAQPKRLRVNHLDYLKSEVSDAKLIPYRPIGDRILVIVDEVAARTTGGIELPFETQEKQNAQSQTGVIVAVGDAAFFWSFDRTRQWVGEKPGVGDRVFFERYAGMFVPGADGRWYRIMDDKCVAALENAALPDERTSAI